MCKKKFVLCGICMNAVGFHTLPCLSQYRYASNHRDQFLQPDIIGHPEPYSCPNIDCIASSRYQNALREQQAMTMLQDNIQCIYKPLTGMEAACWGYDEAYNFAPDPVSANKTKQYRQAQAATYPVQGNLYQPQNGSCQQILPATDPLIRDYPPEIVSGAQIHPNWLSRREWYKVKELQSRGKNILQIAGAVDKNASRLRTYIDTYLKKYGAHYEAPLRSACSTSSSSNSTSSNTASEEGLFPLDEEPVEPVKGMPEPWFLDRQEQEILWRMFQRNESIRNMTERLQKPRQKISQYINAYMRHKLLQLQAEEQEVENSAIPTPITHINGGIIHLPLSNIASFRAEASMTPLMEGMPQGPSLRAAAPLSITQASTSQEPNPQSISAMDPSLAYVDPLLHHLLAIPEIEVPSRVSNLPPLDTPTSASEGDSLFGGSPVEENHAGSHVQSDSTHHDVEPVQNQKKRKFPDSSEMPADPRRFSKRLRHCSLP